MHSDYPNAFRPEDIPEQPNLRDKSFELGCLTCVASFWFSGGLLFFAIGVIILYYIEVEFGIIWVCISFVPMLIGGGICYCARMDQ